MTKPDLLNIRGGDFLDTALMWLDLGQSVIPLGRDKKPLFDQLPWIDGAHRWEPYKLHQPSLSEIYYWFWTWAVEWHDFVNIGLIPSGNLAVLDFDDMPSYEAWRAAYGRDTYQVETWRGIHAYFWLDIPYPRSFDADLDGHKIEVKTAGMKYVMAPPSIHPQGKRYTGNDKPIARVRSMDRIVPVEAKSPLDTEQRIEKLPPPPPDPENPWKVASDPGLYSGANLVETIKKRFKASDFIPDIRPTGGGFGMARCPLHDDHNPSLSVNLKSGDVKCLAGCNGGRWMDAINLLAQREGISNRESIEKLRGML